MFQRIFCISLLILFLFPHGLFSKSPTKQEYASDSESLNTKNDVDPAGIEDNSAIHDNYRPRHKYKTESGTQSRFYRSVLEGEKEQEVKIPQCAVMYKNSEPVGILQPFEDSYRFLQVSGEPTLVDINPIPVKRKTIMDVLYPSKMTDDYDNEAVDNTVQFTDDRYPSIFAKFKIDSRLDKSLSRDAHLKRSMHKRGSEKIKLNEQTGSSKSTISKMKPDDSVAVEDELKNILDDMGLIDDYSDNKEEVKRDIEDENLELGTNKISLVKDERKEKRDKRQDQNSSFTLTPTAITSLVNKKSISPLNIAISSKGAQLEGKHVEEERSVDFPHPNENSQLQEAFENAELEVSTEKEAEQEDSRKKRQNEKDNKDSKKRNVDIPRSVEVTTSSLVKEEELSEYEKRVEREIRDKIDKLKSEVKKEISELKETDSKNKKVSFTEDSKRKKRQAINSLLDEESVDINPLMIADEKGKNHIRRKRNTLFEEQYTFNNEPLTNGHDNMFKKLLSVTDNSTVNGNEKKNENNFVGINPILEMGNSTSYHIRSLKQYRDDREPKEIKCKPNTNVKRETSDVVNENNVQNLENAGDKTNIRTKREARENTEDDAYQDDESEFGEDVSYENPKNGNEQNINENMDINSAQLDKIDRQFRSSTSGCKCDKNSNDCKCGNPKVNLNLPNLKQEDSNYLTDAVSFLDKKSANQHCACGKNNNHCKCGHLLDDIPSPYQQDSYSNNQQNAIDGIPERKKKFLDELQSDANAAFPERIRERRKNIFEPTEKNSNERRNSLSEDEYEDDDTAENRFMKRNARFRKFSGNRPFQNGEYFVDLHPDIYRLSPAENSKEKRDNFQLVAMHGENPTKRHLVAIRERSVIPHSRFRRRAQNDDYKQPRQLIDMSDEDLFGALPQSYAGELARYKRVKRSRTKK